MVLGTRVSTYADFEAENYIDNPKMGNKATNFYKQNPVCKG